MHISMCFYPLLSCKYYRVSSSRQALSGTKFPVRCQLSGGVLLQKRRSRNKMTKSESELIKLRERQSKRKCNNKEHNGQGAKEQLILQPRCLFLISPHFRCVFICISVCCCHHCFPSGVECGSCGDVWVTWFLNIIIYLLNLRQLHLFTFYFLSIRQLLHLPASYISGCAQLFFVLFVRTSWQPLEDTHTQTRAHTQTMCCKKCIFTSLHQQIENPYLTSEHSCLLLHWILPGK